MCGGGSRRRYFDPMSYNFMSTWCHMSFALIIWRWNENESQLIDTVDFFWGWWNSLKKKLLLQKYICQFRKSEIFWDVTYEYNEWFNVISSYELDFTTKVHKIKKKDNNFIFRLILLITKSGLINWMYLFLFSTAFIILYWKNIKNMLFLISTNMTNIRLTFFTQVTKMWTEFLSQSPPFIMEYQFVRN